jgi:hypothetical protein
MVSAPYIDGVLPLRVENTYMLSLKWFLLRRHRVVSNTPVGLEKRGTVVSTETLRTERAAEFLTRKIQQNWRLVALLLLVNALGFVGPHFLGDRWQGWASVGAGIVISTTILVLATLTGSVGVVRRW